MGFTRDVKIKTSKTKSHVKKIESTSSTYRLIEPLYRYYGQNGSVSLRTNLEQGWLMKDDFIRDKYIDELARDAHKYPFAHDDITTKIGSRTFQCFPKDCIRLRNGKIERIPIVHSGEKKYMNKERRVPIQYLGGYYNVPKKTSNLSTAILPKRNPRDTLSHRGNLLHFIA